MIQRAMGVHEWCEIRLIRVKGRLDLCEESGRIWHSWAPFWLLFGEAKSDKKINLFLPQLIPYLVSH